jgi:hypothetical protein
MSPLDTGLSLHFLLCNRSVIRFSEVKFVTSTEITYRCADHLADIQCSNTDSTSSRLNQDRLYSKLEINSRTSKVGKLTSPFSNCASRNRE